MAAAAGASVLALAWLSPQASAYERAVPEDFFGVSAPELYSKSLANDLASRTLLDASLTAIDAAGIDTVRTSAGWREAEPAPPSQGAHSYNWAVLDRHVMALASHDQRLLAQFNAPPGWAQAAASADACQRRGGLDPARIGDYAAFAAAFARRYGRDGEFWTWAEAQRPSLPYLPVTTFELWNEPNWAAFWCPSVDPETYAEAVSAAADAIHAVDPGATVAVGGLVLIQESQYYDDGTMKGMATREFLDRMVAAVPSLGADVDAVAIHTYGATVDDNIWLLGWASEQLSAVGLGDERIVISEFGWPTSGSPRAVPEAERALRLGELAGRLARTDCDLVSISPHNWLTAQQDPSDPEDWYGLADPVTGLPLPSAAAYAEQVARYEGGAPPPQAAERLDVCPDDPSTGTPPAGEDTPPAGPGRPKLELLSAPRHRTRDRTPTVRFETRNAAGAEYSLHRGRWLAADSPLTLRRLRSGRHALRLRAIAADGEASSAYRVRFRVVRDRRRS